MYLGSAAAFINHDIERANVQVFVKEGVARLATIRPVAAGEELFLDYRLMHISPEVQLYCARYGLTDVYTMSMHLSPPLHHPGGLELCELQVHNKQFENQVLAGYCKLQTEVYAMAEEKVEAVRQLMARILSGSLLGKIYYAGGTATGMLGSGIVFKTKDQAVSPDGSYAQEKQPYVWVHFIYVERHARNAGISGLILDAAEAFAKQMGCISLRADVACHNGSIARLLRTRSYQPETTVWIKVAAKL
ncbi:unnamed protein product [Symbiodinium sp. CCMP2592]|nr:unnamed protein product [Symbiodinium sp. CCMP2592]